MLLFNELRISEDSKHLIIDVLVLDLVYYENVYLDQIIIDTHKTYMNTGPSQTPVYTLQLDGDIKHIRAIVDVDGIAKNMFFVYIIAKGEPAENTPCGMKYPILLGITYSKILVLRPFMDTLKLVSTTCDIPDDFLRLTARYEAFKVALDAGNYTKAIQLWDNFFNVKVILTSRPCGCYGS